MSRESTATLVASHAEQPDTIVEFKEPEMNCRIWLSVVCLWCGSVQAQSVTADAVEIAEVISVQGWKTIEQGLPAIVMQLEANLRSNGATSTAASTFARDFQNAMTQDAVARIYAQIIAQKMSASEQKSTLDFLQSSAGTKFLSIGGSGGQDVQDIAVPLLRELCTSIKTKVSAADALSLAPCR